MVVVVVGARDKNSIRVSLVLEKELFEDIE